MIKRIGIRLEAENYISYSYSNMLYTLRDKFNNENGSKSVSGSQDEISRAESFIFRSPIYTVARYFERGQLFSRATLRGDSYPIRNKRD